MVICTDGVLEKWSPDFSSSGQANPSWTRLRFRKLELCNSLASVDWDENPVQVQICDACGTIQCASGGYVHISRCRDLVLWTSPQIESSDEWTRSEYAAAWPLTKLGAIAFPPEAWNALRRVEPSMPDISALGSANGRAIADAWLLGPGRPVDSEELLPWLRAGLIGGDTLDRDSAIRLVERWLHSILDEGGSESYSVKSRSDLSAETETLYFDGPRAEDWLAFARRENEYFPALDDQHVLFDPQQGGNLLRGDLL